MSKDNSNCLEGIKCKVCGQQDRFFITGTTEFEVHDDGTESHGDAEWGDESPCRCPCGHHGCLADFRSSKEPRLKPFSVLLQYPDWLQPSDGLETYYEHVSAVDAQDAVVLVQQAAAAVNRSYGVKPKDFTPVIVLAGHCEAEAYNDSLKG